MGFEEPDTTEPLLTEWEEEVEQESLLFPGQGSAVISQASEEAPRQTGGCSPTRCSRREGAVTPSTKKQV